MTDSKLELIEEIVILTYDLGLDRKKCPVTRLSRKILALCEPEWIPVDDGWPNENPLRNIRVVYLDAAGTKYSAEVASTLVRHTPCYAWKEVEPLPEPPEAE